MGKRVEQEGTVEGAVEGTWGIGDRGDKGGQGGQVGGREGE